MKRRNLLALAFAPLAPAIELKEAPRIINKTQWTQTISRHTDADDVTVMASAYLWVYPYEREEHARKYMLGYTLYKDQIVHYPDIGARMQEQLQRSIRDLERDLLAAPIDWHGKLRTRG